MKQLWSRFKMSGRLVPKLSTPDLVEGLPARGNLRTLFTLSFIIAVLVAMVSVAGILSQDYVYRTEILANTFVPNDIVNLLIGVPFILVSLLLTMRGKQGGLLCWPGALFYFTYVFFPYIICVPVGILFIPHLIIVTASLYTLIGVIAGTDGNALQKKVSKNLPARTFGVILVALGILIILRQTWFILDTVINDKTIGTQELAVWIDDFVFGSPAMIIGGALLWRRKSLGYVLGPGLYLVFGMLTFGLIPFTLIQSRLIDTSPGISSIGLLLLMSAICMIPFIFLLRGVYKK